MNGSAGIHNTRIEGSYAKGVKYLRDADQLMLKLRSMLQASGLSSGGLHEWFAPDVYAYARVGMGVAVVNIVADPDEDRLPEEILLDRLDRPDFLCGLIYGGTLERRTDDEGREYKALQDFRPDLRTRRLFKMEEGRQESRRLAVSPDPVLADELANKSGFGPEFSQYTRLAPSMYSGTMKKLVQVLMGYGRFEPPGIYGREFESITELDRFQYTPEFLKEIARNGTQIRYDWRYFRTHGLTRAADGKWWVVEIRSGRGIHAIPLSLYPQTTSDKFRRAVEDKGDEAGLEVLDLFGGFPTGESFPGNQLEFQSLVRAGLIVQGATSEDVQPFYNHAWYSPYMGWAFSESGRQAHNTGWRTDPDLFQTGVHYSTQLTIGATTDLTPRSGLADTLKRHVAAARDQVGDDFKWLIRGVLFKIDRMTDNEIRPLLAQFPAVAFGFIDRQIFTPIASFSAPVAMAGSGRLYAPSANTLQLKFYDPGVGGLLSHDMRAERGADIANPPNTDTVVHVFFTGESLRYVKAFIRPRFQPESTDEVSGELECDLIGESQQTTTTDLSREANGVYSQEFDDRSVSFQARTVTTTRGSRIGPVAIGFGDRLPQLFIADVFRTWAFRREQVTENNGTEFVRSALAVPQYTREGYYYAVNRQSGSGFKITSINFPRVGDAYSYSAWRNVPGFTGFLPMGCVGTPSFPACWQLAEHPAGCGKVTDRHIWEEFVSDTECSALTNGGPWASTCQQVEPMVYNIPQQGSSDFESIPRKSNLKVFFVSNSDFSPIKTLDQDREGEGAEFHGDPWFIPSPTPLNMVQFISAYQNEMGSGNVVKHSPNINTGATELIGSPQFPDMKDEGVTFIGVING
jgi:hypothetical protein